MFVSYQLYLIPRFFHGKIWISYFSVEYLALYLYTQLNTDLYCQINKWNNYQLCSLDTLQKYIFFSIFWTAKGKNNVWHNSSDLSLRPAPHLGWEAVTKLVNFLQLVSSFIHRSWNAQRQELSAILRYISPLPKQSFLCISLTCRK